MSKLFRGSKVTHRVLSWDDVEEDYVTDSVEVVRLADQAGFRQWGEPHCEVEGYHHNLESFARLVAQPLEERINELEHEIIELRKLVVQLPTPILYQDDIVQNLGG